MRTPGLQSSHALKCRRKGCSEQGERVLSGFYRSSQNVVNDGRREEWAAGARDLIADQHVVDVRSLEFQEQKAARNAQVQKFRFFVTCHLTMGSLFDMVWPTEVRRIVRLGKDSLCNRSSSP
jgi:hypothetical protein